MCRDGTCHDVSPLSMESVLSRRSIGIPCTTQSNGNNNGGLSRIEAIAERRSIPGVMLFAGTGDVLFMNAEAEVLSRQIIGARFGAGLKKSYPLKSWNCVCL